MVGVGRDIELVFIYPFIHKIQGRELVSLH